MFLSGFSKFDVALYTQKQLKAEQLWKKWMGKKKVELSLDSKAGCKPLSLG